VELHYDNGRIIKVRVHAELAPANLVDSEVVIVTVKAYDTEQAARLHCNYVRPGVQVISLQNGLGNVETLARIFKRQSILAALTTEASLSLGSGRVIYTGRGGTRVGKPDGKVTQESLAIAREFRRAGLKCVATGKIGGAIWSKALVNAAINPVSAITQLRNGELANLQGLRDVMLSVIREGVSVSHAENATPTPEPEGFLFKILKDTAHNRSSMLQDIQRGKRTEILQLNGAITQLGLKHRIGTPTNKVLTLLVLGLEASVLE
jgi:2-dehydropantoate 2-reductase